MSQLQVYTAPISDGSGDVAFFDLNRTAVIVVSAFKGTRQFIFDATGYIYKGTTIQRETHLMSETDTIRTKAQMTAFAKRWVRANYQHVIAQGHTPA